ncbi:plant-specific TFIIB-related protein PTF2 [Asparagus officinalis]|uniref:plant-specific TFIIB-related protein PTF2 n=1 Tax=Asparagus officinalis TaxID=4686 RepID=UPI00098E11EE|nr:plant-specific TFIIB-related protein PTF2 [Asparagus officinalis]
MTVGPPTCAALLRRGPTIYGPGHIRRGVLLCGPRELDRLLTSVPPSRTLTHVHLLRLHLLDFTYHQRKLLPPKTLIQDVTSRLGLSARSSTRSSPSSPSSPPPPSAPETVFPSSSPPPPTSSPDATLPLSSTSAAAAAASSRVELPDFDAAGALDRAVRTCPCFAQVQPDKKEELIAMGRFLIQCMTKWFLMTGRRPLPTVATVVALTTEVNGVGVEIEEIAKEIYAVTSTCRMRHRELKETLLKVAAALLPWGKDVNLKNLVHNMPVLVRLMESKARSVKRNSGVCEGFEFKLDEYLTVYSNAEEEEGSEYFRAVCEGGSSGEEFHNVEISGERLVNAYNNVLAKIDEVRDAGGLDNEQAVKRRKTRRELEDQGSWDSWEGRWDLGKKLSLQEVLERDVGFDALPPSFINGIESREKRKLKIEAAKRRINRTVDPLPIADLPLEDDSLSKPAVCKKWSGGEVGIKGVDWEDCIIELLLLHRVDEEEIEEGQYNRLLDLHVFNSLSSLSAER